MKKKRNFLLPLLMMLLMMAMSPQKVWATANVTWSLGGAFDFEPAAGVWVGSSEEGGEQITSGHLYLCFTSVGSGDDMITQLTSLSSNSGLDGACVDAMKEFLAANSQWNGYNANNPNFSANCYTMTGGAFGTSDDPDGRGPSVVTIDGIDKDKAYDVVAIIFDTKEITADSRYVVIKGYGELEWYTKQELGLLEIGFASEWYDGNIDKGYAAPNNAVDGKWHAVGGHSLTAHPAVAVTCTTDGNSAYWSCSVCNKYFNDAEGNNGIAASSVVISASGHTIKAHDAVTATCTTDGYSSACWGCSKCGKYFSDAGGNNVIAASSVVIPAGHNFVNGICSVCGTGSITDSEVTDDNGNTITISTVVGNVVLTEDALYKKLVLSNNATLTINQGVTLHVDAMEVGAGCKVTNSGTISYYTYMYDINIYGSFVNLGTIEYGTLKLYDDATACNHGTFGYNAAIYGEYSMYYSTSGGQVCYPFQGGTLYDAIYPGTTSSVSVPATCTTAGTEKTSCDVCGTTLSETPTAIDPDAHSWENNTCTLCAAVRITYTASAKLAETTDVWSAGLHTNVFGSATITSHTFENGVGTITFSGELTSIGDNAFYQCSDLTGITIPSGVTSIGEGAFESCTNLTGITIPSGVTSIGHYAFITCFSLASITIPSSVTSVGEMSFRSCYVTSSNLHNSSSIDLTQYDLTIVDTEQEDGLLIKDNCAVTCRPGATSLNIPSSVTSIGAYAFNERSNLSSITFTTPSSVTSIGEYAFYKCSNLASITIPGSVTSIGTQAFYYCSNLTSVTIPSSVTSIGGGAFGGCTSLTTVICKGATPATLGDYAFKYVNEEYIVLPNLQNIYVPASSVDTYKAATNWSDYAEKINAMPDAITLSDEEDPTSTLAIWATANAAQDITLTGRTLYKDGYYNTLCLPFALTATELAADNCPLKGCTLKEVTGASLNTTTNVMTIQLTDATALEAGKPYLIKWESGDNITSPTFTGVTITKSEPNTITGDNLDVMGIFAPKTMATSDTDLFFLGAENKFYTSNAESGANLKGYRCFFKQKGASGEAKALNFVLDDDVTTSVTSISPLGELEGAPVYNLQGVRVGSGYKGIVIKNGRKYINK